jgi:hypothetical protein
VSAIIRLLACKVQETEDSEQIEGYHVLVAAAWASATLAREIHRDVGPSRAGHHRRLLKGLSGARRRMRPLPGLVRRHDDAAIKQMTG